MGKECGGDDSYSVSAGRRVLPKFGLACVERAVCGRVDSTNYETAPVRLACGPRL